MSEEWPPKDVVRVDLGHGVSWSRVVDQEENWIGILEWHICKDPDRLTPGGVYFENAPHDVHGARWTVESLDPLTISPSVLCRSCGLHGFIRDGRWIPA